MTTSESVASPASPSIVVLGSTGKTGRRIVRLLAERGIAVRGASRRATPPFDWEKQETWPAVLRGARSVYVSYVPDLAVQTAPAAIEALVACARTAGVERLVLLSGRGEQSALRCEAIVRDSGLRSTRIRASWFSQNFTEGYLHQSVLDGVIAMPAGDVREPFVDVDDIADVAVAALTDDRHDGKLYELTGPRLLSFADASAEIAKASGRKLEYAAITLGQFYEGVAATLGADVASLYTGLCKEVFDGRNASTAHGVREALGREPRDFSAFCRAAAASGAWQS